MKAGARKETAGDTVTDSLLLPPLISLHSSPATPSSFPPFLDLQPCTEIPGHPDPCPFCSAGPTQGPLSCSGPVLRGPVVRLTSPAGMTLTLTALPYSLALEFNHGPSCLPMGSDQTTTQAFETGMHHPTAPSWPSYEEPRFRPCDPVARSRFLFANAHTLVLYCSSAVFAHCAGLGWAVDASPQMMRGVRIEQNRTNSTRMDTSPALLPTPKERTAILGSQPAGPSQASRGSKSQRPKARPDYLSPRAIT